MRLREIMLATVALVPATASAQYTTLGTAGTANSSAFVQAVNTVASKSAGRAYDLWRSVGMNVHLEYSAASGMGDNPNADDAKMEAAIKYLNLSSARTYPGGDAPARMATLHAATGILFDFSLTTGWGLDYNAQAALVRQALAAGELEAIGNANEIDNWPPSFNGLTGYAAAAAQQQQLWNDFGSSGVSIYATSVASPSNLANLGVSSSTANYSDAHTYPPSGAQPSTWLPGWLAQSQSVSPFFVQTEAGYSTLAAGAQAHDSSVSERAQARLILNLLLDSYQLGVAHTYIYELLDAGYSPGMPSCDPGQTDRERHYGMYRCDWSAKPVVDALHTFMSVIADKAPTSTQAGALNYSVSGVPAGKNLLLQKSDGSFIIVVWVEPTIWDPNSLSDIQAPTQTATVAFGENARTVTVYDPIAGDTPIATASNASSVDVPVTDHPVLIVVNGTTGIGGSALMATAMGLANVQAANAPTASLQPLTGTTSSATPAATTAPAVTTTAGGTWQRTGTNGTGSAPVASTGSSPGTSTATTSPRTTATSAIPVASSAAVVPAGVGAETFSVSGTNALSQLATNFSEWNVNTLAANGDQETYTGPGSGIGCYNPFSTSNGNLVITAEATPASCQGQVGTQYVSGMLDSSGSFSQKYGYFDVTAQIPGAKGTWPSLWLTSQTSAGVYEIDIVEAIGEPNTIHFSTHIPDGGGTTQAVTLPFDPSSGMHTYGVLWTPTAVTLYVDGVARANADATGLQSAPAMHWIVANGVGGNWPGSYDGSAPVTMQVQSINAYALGQ